ncbi:MAG TPA: 50S ribosomal protein L4 [Verrucomicrobiales bacterium]|jgi:large subunit ribosomal protein L4|nr:50S ribosomal protein L4 [Verrucomicrobiales bacterium]
MASQVFTLEAAKAANISVIENGRYTQAVHDVVTAIRANGRSGTAKTKTRGEVAGSNKKLYRQKGTGNARAGEKRAPTRSGGGTAHGPKIRDYSKKVSKKTKKLAFSKALSERIKAGDVVTVNSFSVADGKTASFVKQLGSAVEGTKVLVIAAAFDELTYRAARNHSKALLITADEANTLQLLNYRKIIITADAMETLARRTA